MAGVGSSKISSMSRKGLEDSRDGEGLVELACRPMLAIPHCGLDLWCDDGGVCTHHIPQVSLAQLRRWIVLVELQTDRFGKLPASGSSRTQSELNGRIRAGLLTELTG